MDTFFAKNITPIHQTSLSCDEVYAFDWTGYFRERLPDIILVYPLDNGNEYNCLSIELGGSIKIKNTDDRYTLQGVNYTYYSRDHDPYVLFMKLIKMQAKVSLFVRNGSGIRFDIKDGTITLTKKSVPNYNRGRPTALTQTPDQRFVSPRISPNIMQFVSIPRPSTMKYTILSMYPIRRLNSFSLTHILTIVKLIPQGIKWDSFLYLNI